MLDITHTLPPDGQEKALFRRMPHGEVTAWGGSGRPRLPPAAAVLVSWLETRRAADTVWMRRLSSGTPRGRQTLGKHRVVTHSGPTWTPSRFQLATARAPSCEHTRVGLLASHASAVSHVHLPKCCLCSSPEMLMGGRGAGARQPPRLGEPPPPVLPAAWGAGRWDGTWQGVCRAEILAVNTTNTITDHRCFSGNVKIQQRTAF